MDTYSMSFVTIGNLVSPSSSVNGNPLDDFPDHWQPRFFSKFPLRRTRRLSEIDFFEREINKLRTERRL
jgi:hypothetical protein